MAAADLVSGELVHVVDIDNGARLTTYVIDANTSIIGFDGAAARLVFPGDLVILMSFRQVEEKDVEAHHPRVVHVDAENRIVTLDSEPMPAFDDQYCGAFDAHTPVPAEYKGTARSACS